MTSRQPVEFTHRRADGTYERAGNQVELVGGNGNGGEPQVLLVDEITGALAIIDTPHHEVHEGETYRAWLVTPHGSLIANDAFVDLVLTTATLYPHITFALGFGGDCEFNIYREPTFNLNGTLQAPHNLKDYSANTSTVTVRWQPTVTNVGAEIDGEFFPGGTGGNASGGSIRRGTEDIFRLATSYLIRITNRSGNARQFSLEAQWYEEDTPG